MSDEKLTVRQASQDLGIDGADLYLMILNGEVEFEPTTAEAKVYITRAEVERLRATLVS